MTNTSASSAATPASSTSRVWPALLAGGICWLFAVPSSVQIAALAWFAWPLLLIWSRLTKRLTGALLGVTAVSVLANIWALQLANFDHWLALLLVSLLVLPVDLLPVLADRLAWRRLPAWAGLLVFPATASLLSSRWRTSTRWVGCSTPSATPSSRPPR